MGNATMLPDSSVANQSASARLSWAPRQVSLAASLAHDDRAHLPFVETPRVPRIFKAELLEIEMMAEFMAESAQECAEGRDFLTNRRPHPHANQHGIGGVVAEEFECRTLSGA